MKKWPLSDAEIKELAKGYANTAEAIADYLGGTVVTEAVKNFDKRRQEASQSSFALNVFNRPTEKDWEKFKEQGRMERGYAKGEFVGRYWSQFGTPSEEKPSKNKVKHPVRVGMARPMPSAEIPLKYQTKVDRICKQCGTERACSCWKQPPLDTGNRLAKGGDPTEFSGSTGLKENKNQQKRWFFDSYEPGNSKFVKDNPRPQA